MLASTKGCFLNEISLYKLSEGAEYTIQYD